jgi:hypothetical protein
MSKAIRLELKLLVYVSLLDWSKSALFIKGWFKKNFACDVKWG